jgi:hypothetical protein
MKTKSSAFEPELAITPGQWDSLALALIDLGLEPADVDALAETIRAAGSRPSQSVRLAVDDWVRRLKIECAHGLCSIDSPVLNAAVVPLLDKYFSRPERD